LTDDTDSARLVPGLLAGPALLMIVDHRLVDAIQTKAGRFLSASRRRSFSL